MYKTFFETEYFAWFPILDAITASLTQGYFARYAWRLNGHNWPLLGLISVSPPASPRLSPALNSPVFYPVGPSQYSAADAEEPPRRVVRRGGVDYYEARACILRL